MHLSCRAVANCSIIGWYFLKHAINHVVSSLMKAREHFCWLNFSYTKNIFGGLKKSSKKVWVRFMVNLFKENYTKSTQFTKRLTLFRKDLKIGCATSGDATEENSWSILKLGAKLDSEVINTLHEPNRIQWTHSVRLISGWFKIVCWFQTPILRQIHIFTLFRLLHWILNRKRNLWLHVNKLR